jgi:mono/diheme cytochrome c family protein
VLVGCLGVAWAAAAVPRAAPQEPAAAPGADTRAVLSRYCFSCHNERTRSGGLALDTYDVARLGQDAAVWERVVRRLRTGTMPPVGMPRPDDPATEAVVSSLESGLDRAAREPDPGRPLLHRLNRAEYANVIRDLLALEVDVRTLLPPDDAAFGFDNNADLQSVSASLLERYLGAADRVSALALGDPRTAPGSETYRVRGDQSQSRHLEGLPLGTVGGIAVEHMFPLDADYDVQLGLFRTNLEAIRGLEHPHQIEITVDGERVFLETVGGDADAGRPGATITERSDAIDRRLRVRVPVKAGPRVIAATFIRKTGFGTTRLRPFLRSNAGTYDSTGRPHIETVTVTGPFNATGPGDTPSRRRVLVCTPAAPREERPCAIRILSTLARRAYRRPTQPADIERLLAFYDDGRASGGFEDGIRLALRRILASPSFLFRIEDPGREPAGRPYAVSDLELASRLSFFVWSSMPDDALLEAAEAGRLRQPGVLDAQVRRLLADPRSHALVENFAGQWLHVRNLQNIAPNTDEFPDFDDDLRQAFRRETELFVESIVREDRSALELMTADHTFVNERLARHYGIPHVYGSHFRRVTVADEARRGLLGKGSVLLATSHADRTAPVLRGKWILENLLGTPPPPPPPNVPALEPEPGTKPRTLRERMEMHRRNPACASCHRSMDALGFAMENFDAVGAWRTREAGQPIDASGMVPDGTPVEGVVALREALLRRPEVFVGTFTEKLLTYALGRGLEHYDMPVVRRIVRDAAGQDYRMSALVLGIARSAPFQMRR